MAVVRGPMMGLSARGKFGGVLVHYVWKGIHVVRVLVFPAQPNTPPQVFQKGIVAAWNTDWQTTPWTELDYASWRRLASLRPSSETGPNQHAREFIRVARIPSGWSRFWNGLEGAQAGFDRRIVSQGQGGYANVHFQHGLRPHVLINDVVATAWDGAVWYLDIPLGTYASGDRVYWQVYDGVNYATSIGSLGIHQFDMP